MRYRRLLALFLGVLLCATAAAGAPAADPLTAEQRAWLDAHPVIRLAPDPDFAPIEFFDDNGSYAGLAADYARLVAQKLGCTFTVVRCASWSEVLEKAQRREVDLLNAAVRTPDREAYLRFARPYLHMPMVIITRRAGEVFTDARSLSGKRVALVRNYGHAELIVRENPAIRPLPVADAAAGLRAVAFGEADAFYHDLATASLSIERAGVSTLRVTGTGSVDNMSGFAVRRDWEPLAGILERGMALVSPEEYAALQARWISMRVPPQPGWRDHLPQLAAGVGIAALLLVIALLGNLTLKREVARRTRALSETEKTLRTALRIGQMGYGTKDTAGNVYWSPEVYRQHGLEPGSIPPTADNLLAQIHPDDRERVSQTIAVVMRGEFAPGIEFRTLPRDGRHRWLYGEWHAAHDAHGTYVGLIGVTQDITARKEHEEELRREKQFTENILAAQRDTVGIIDPDIARPLRWNRRVTEVTGYTDTEIAGVLGVLGCHPPEHHARIRAAMARLLATGEPVALEADILTRDGRRLPYEFILSLFHDQSTGRRLCCSVGRDISDRTAAAAALQREKEFAEQVMNAQTDTVVVIAPDGSRLIRWNRAACVVTGYTDNELAHLPLSAVHPTRCAADLQRAVAVLDRDGELCIELPLLTKDGRELPYEFNVTLVRDAQGQPRFLCSVGRDIAERNAIAQVLRESAARLRSVLETLPFDIWMMDTGGHYVLQNEASRALWGDVTGKRPADVAQDEAQRTHWESQNRAVLAGERLEGEATYTVNGEEHDFHYVLSRITDDERALGIVGVNIDVTGNRRAERALRASEERYRSLFTTMTDGVALHELVTGADGLPQDYRILDVNPAYEQILGIPRDRVAGQLGSAVYGVTPAPYLEEYARVARSGIPHGFTAYFAPLQRHFKIAVYAPEPGKFATVFEDVSERLRTEGALREAQELFSAFMRHSPVYTFIKEVTAECSRVVQASENYAEMIGIAGSAMTGKTMEELFPVEFARKITADDWAVVQGGTVLKLDEDLNGRHYTTIKFPIVQGGRTLLAGYTIDITDRVRAEQELRASEEKFAKAFRSASVLMALSTVDDGRYLDVNDTFLQTLGYTREQIIGQTSHDLGIFADPDARDRLLQVLRVEGTVNNVETAVRTADGCLRFGLFSAEIVAIGGRSCLLTSLTDITGRKQAEAALQAEEERYRSIIEQASDAIFQGDPQGRIVVVNDAAVALTGLTRAELLQRSMRDLFPAEELQAKPLRYDLLRQGQTVTVERRLRQADGAVLTVEMTSKMLSNGTYLCAMRDITERSRLLAELRASTERYQTLFSVESDAILLIDASDQRIVEANPAACHLYGSDHAELLRLRITDLSAEPEATAQVIAAGGDEAIRIPLRWHRRRDGSQFPVEITARFFTLAGRRLLLSAMRDIGDRLRQEAERERLLAALTAANNDLRSLDELKSNLLSNVSHELRTPLVAVRGYAEMMREGMSGPVTARQGEQFGIMLRNIDRLLTLIDNLLDYSRQQKGQEPLQCSAFPVAGLVHDAVTLLLPRAQEKQVTLHVADAGDGLQLTGDRRKLQQVLINLVDNALKFTPQGGTVTLAAASGAAGTLCLTVQDTGIGIPEHQHERIFERFYQVDGSSTRGHSGTGIGLAIVRDIVTLHGGKIAVASTPGEGTVFTVTLPAGGPAAA